MAWLKRGTELSWRVNHRLKSLHVLKNRLKLLANYKDHVVKRFYHNGRTSRNVPSSHQVRREFIKYFTARDHLHVPSSSIIPRADDNTYFVNAGMIQFKPILLGTVDPNSPLASYKRAVNSQRCVRVGGKHNDLEDVGKDTTHHTFFEMLGSWSFGDYFKREACHYAWDMLTTVYGIHPSHLYVTYFGGDQSLALEPDIECRDIWREIGVPAERVIPAGAADNFWDMGDTGPCGPCTEIHYAYSNSGKLSHLVNKDSTKVMEIWNLVFMQYNRQPDGSLKTLPRTHVDTGMGLERITAVLQGQTSNYDTDLFKPIFKEINNLCSVKPYGGLVGADDGRGVDTAYRIVADHMRMATVALADGIRPGKDNTDGWLKLIIHRATKQARDKLRAPPNLMGRLVPIVIDTLGEAFRTDGLDASAMADILNHVEWKLADLEAASAKTLDRALQFYNIADAKSLTADQVIDVYEGRFGKSGPLDIIEDVCQKRNISLDLQQIHEQIKLRKLVTLQNLPMRDNEKRDTLDQYHVVALQAQKVPHTDDSHKYSYFYDDGDYSFPLLSAKVVGLVGDAEVVGHVQGEGTWGVVLDQTCFYSEAGGQAADTGYLQTDTGNRIIVRNVQTTSGYVLHTCIGNSGQLSVGDKVTMFINQERRQQCMKNHTGAHIVNYALEEVLGDITQRGAVVTPNKFTLDFSCSKMEMDNEDVKKVSSIATNLVECQLPVYIEEMTLEQSRQVNGLRSMQDVVYPTNVRVISIGAPSDRLIAQTISGLPSTHSAELCGGTHVHNTGDLGALVVTHFRGMTRGTRTISCVTGSLASQALENGRMLRSKLTQLTDSTEADSPVALIQQVETALGVGEMLLPKLDREALVTGVDLIKFRSVNQSRNATTKSDLTHRLEVLLSVHMTDCPLVREFAFVKPRDISKILYDMQPRVPLMLFTSGRKWSEPISGVCYVPENSRERLSPRKWAEYVASSTNGTARAPNSKPNKPVDRFVYIYQSVDKSTTLQQVQELALSYANLYKEQQL